MSAEDRPTNGLVRPFDPRSYSGMTGLVRFSLSTTMRITGWATRGSVEATTDFLRQVSSGEPITEIVDARVEAVRSAVWHVLGLDRQQPATTTTTAVVSLRKRGGAVASLGDLRRQGDHLLQQLGDPHSPPRNEHPAFSRMLAELVPDEARILRFLALAGPQPAIDVRTRTPLGVGSELLANGINLIAEMSGCTYPDRNQQYLANLNRLGMIAFSEEQVEDPRRYSFIEAQPVAAAAMARAKRSVTVYRSVHITQFGEQFCEVCFTLEGYDAGGWINDVR